MSDFTLRMDHVIHTFNEALYHMINAKIKIGAGKFPVVEMIPFIRATDGSTTVFAFIAQLSGNQKELNGSFTTDAFIGMAPNLTIEFGFGEEVFGSLENTNIADIHALDPFFSDVMAPDADNAWLENLLSNQV